MQYASTFRFTRGFAALVVALSLPLASAMAGEGHEFTHFTPPEVPSGRGLPSVSAPDRFINTLLPIAPTNGLDQRLGLDLSKPTATITVTGGGPLGLLPGGGAPSCNIGQEGLAAGLATCGNVVNVQGRNDLLN